MEDKAAVLNSLLSQYEAIILAELKTDLESKINTKFAEIEDSVNAKLDTLENAVTTKLTELENHLNLKFTEKVLEMENNLNTRFDGLNKQDLTIERERNKLESVRVAQLTLIENSRSLPVEEREITAQKIKDFADNLNTYITAQ